MKSRFSLLHVSPLPDASVRPLARLSFVRWLSLVLPLVALSACATPLAVNSESTTAPNGVTAEGATAGGGGANPEMAVRLPSLRLASNPPMAIDALTAEKTDETVTVSGTILQRSALLDDGWLYQLQDDSGSVWILTERSIPQVNTAVTVEGVVRYEPIVVDEIDASGIYLEEQSYREVNE